MMHKANHKGQGEEKGYPFTKIPNNLLEALLGLPLSSMDYKIIFLIIRKTFGWHKTQDYISLTQFEGVTGKSRTSVCTSLKKLIARNIVKCVKKSSSSQVANSYRINCDPATWVLVKKTALVNVSVVASKESTSNLVPNTLHTKEIEINITKEKNQEPGFLSNNYNLKKEISIKNNHSIDSEANKARMDEIVAEVAQAKGVRNPFGLAMHKARNQ